MHFEASSTVCGEPIDAHSVQRSGTLARIVDATNHVFMFDPTTTTADGLYGVARIGWRRASTFAGFCAHHDNVTFAPIDDHDFVATPEQCFLLAYRALCHELHARVQSQRAQRHIRDAGDRGFAPGAQVVFQLKHDAIAYHLQRGFVAFEELRNLMNRELRDRSYSNIVSVILTFSGPLSVAGAGLVSPTRDIDGVSLQDLADQTVPQESLFYNVIAGQQGGAIVLSWRRGTTKPALFVQSVLKRPQCQIASLLLQFAFAHLQNMYFSSDWWVGLRPAQKSHLWKLASIADPYYTQFEYRAVSNLLPWTIINRTHGDGGVSPVDELLVASMERTGKRAG
jgi:hypothetical protein